MVRPSSAFCLLFAPALVLLAGSAAAARLDPRLDAALAHMDAQRSVDVVVTFHGEGPPDDRNLALLQTQRLAGLTLRALPIAAVRATPGQIRSLLRHRDVRSIWLDRADTAGSAAAAGAGSAARGPAPAAVAPHARVEGFSGRGIAVLFADAAPAQAAPATAAASGTRLEPIHYADFPGSEMGLDPIAPGAEVIGYRPGSGSPLLAALGAYDYALSHQFEYNIRVVSGALATGSGAPYFDPDDPSHVATRALADRGVVVVVPAQASGRSGATAPWVVTTAAADGTAAAPHLCGVVALMLEANPALSWREVKDILRQLRADSGARGKRLDAAQAVMAALQRGGMASRSAARGYNAHSWLSAIDARIE